MKMKFLVIMTILVNFVISKTAINCPDKCRCDKLTNLRRVKCSNLNLMNIGDDIPSSVDILDISYNQISELFENEFMNLDLTSMKLLNISHNKISHIHLKSFRNLNKVKIIDLSYNIIEYVLQEWFSDIPKLKELYLNNNNFFKLNTDGALVASKSLEVLDLSYCKITQIKTDTFSNLQKLKVLNLEGNFLIEINSVAMKNLKSLELLTVKENPFNCGKTMNDLKKYLKSTNVKYTDPCTKPKQINTIEKFQKIITLEDPIDENNLWLYDDNDENTDNNGTSCNCTNIERTKQGIVLEIIEMSPVLSIIITLVTGFVLGMIIACNVQIKSSKSNVRKRPRRYSVIRSTYLENSAPLVLNCENIYESTPLPQRRMEMYQLY